MKFLNSELGIWLSGVVFGIIIGNVLWVKTGSEKAWLIATLIAILAGVLMWFYRRGKESRKG